MSASATRREAATEASGPALLRYESQLPRLPVNSLQETTERWLHSVKPFTVDVGDSAGFERAKELAKELRESKTGKALQERLEKRAETEDNWLIDWWNYTAYFAPRDSLAFANYFFGHIDDRSRTTGPARAASLIRALLYFRHMTESGILEPEMARKTPLAMSSYKYLFNTCRFPRKDVDTAQKYDAAANNHFTVLRRGKFYEIQVVDESGQFLSEADIRVQLEKVVEMAGSEEDPYPIGALTTWNRDNWAEAREELLRSAPENAQLMKRVASSIFILALDSVSPITREQKTLNWWIGQKSGNRFMDKHTLMVTDNGKSGFSGEHSMLDGTPTTRLNDWMIRSLSAGKIDLGSSTPSSNVPQPKHLDFKLNDKVKSAITQALKDVDALKAEHQVTVLQYSGYGKDVIKNFNCSPDSWAQLTMQLAYYKMNGKLAGTYESAQTRKFKLGRTEVIRSATTEAAQWCKAMEDSSVSNTDRLSLFQRAASAHIHYAQAAANGQGVDRHFFGLKKLLKEGEELPAIFNDPVFADSSTWTLSTSQLSSEFFDTWGYSEVVDDGFGLAYSVNSDSLRFCIITKTGKDKEFAHYIEEAAHEMRKSLGQGLAASNSDSAPKAKL